jgi:hypothetical protein
MPPGTTVPPKSLRHNNVHNLQEVTVGSGKGALLWLIGIPLPIILLAIFMHH